ncbi:MAG: hypothetical protein M1826_000493 [Phylliscum demangeonii]|nr:MAG: hypothetical protein M1826_000493 [Phylliscum demangeonii]
MVLAPLGRLDLVHVSNVLLSIQQRQRREGASTGSLFDSALERSIELLSDPYDDDEVGRTARPERSRKRARCIFVFSPAGSHYVGHVPDDLLLHLINPSAVSWLSAAPAHRGWQLHVPPSTAGDRAEVGEDGSGASYKVRQVLQDTRAGMSAGHLVDVAIHITPASTCRIEAVLGATHVDRLHAGQSVSVLVRLQVGAIPPVLPSCSLDGGRPLDRMIAELDALIGIRAEELFEVDVRYQHPLFSQDTKLCTSGSATIRRRITRTSSGGAASYLEAEELLRRIHVHHRLAQLIASTYPPSHAIPRLEERYGRARRNLSPSPDNPTPSYPFLRPLIKELRYRARQGGASNTTDPSHAAPRIASILDTTHIHVPSPSPSPSPPRTPLSPPPPPSARADEARQIWQQMRRNRQSSRPSDHHHHHLLLSPPAHRSFSPPSHPGSPCPAEVETLLADLPSPGAQFLREMVQQALKNKRSVGTDTLNSLKSLAVGMTEAAITATTDGASDGRVASAGKDEGDEEEEEEDGDGDGDGDGAKVDDDHDNDDDDDERDEEGEGASNPSPSPSIGSGESINSSATTVRRRYRAHHPSGLPVSPWL